MRKCDVRILDLRADPVNDLAKIVRRNVRCHADRDAGPAVDEEVGEGRGENRGLGQSFVVVRNEVHRVLVHVLHQHRSQRRQARLGVTHCCGRVALDRTKVPLPLHQQLPHRPGLGHMDQRRVDHRFAVGVKIAARITADFRAFVMLSAGIEVQAVHRVEDAALGRLETIPGVGQGS